ncbi:MAG: hypothetical protein LBT40_01110, partial [Deltaproteobacteria bacterium]|nr:hypothetical protein [Deltaproteobacteria bacterium]
MTPSKRLSPPAALGCCLAASILIIMATAVIPPDAAARKAKGPAAHPPQHGAILSSDDSPLGGAAPSSRPELAPGLPRGSAGRSDPVYVNGDSGSGLSDRDTGNVKAKRKATGKRKRRKTGAPASSGKAPENLPDGLASATPPHAGPGPVSVEEMTGRHAASWASPAPPSTIEPAGHPTSGLAGPPTVTGDSGSGLSDRDTGNVKAKRKATGKRKRRKTGAPASAGKAPANLPDGLASATPAPAGPGPVSVEEMTGRHAASWASPAPPSTIETAGHPASGLAGPATVTDPAEKPDAGGVKIPSASDMTAAGEGMATAGTDPGTGHPLSGDADGLLEGLPAVAPILFGTGGKVTESYPAGGVASVLAEGRRSVLLAQIARDKAENAESLPEGKGKAARHVGVIPADGTAASEILASKVPGDGLLKAEASADGNQAAQYQDAVIQADGGTVSEVLKAEAFADRNQAAQSRDAVVQAAGGPVSGVLQAEASADGSQAAQTQDAVVQAAQAQDAAVQTAQAQEAVVQAAQTQEAAVQAAGGMVSGVLKAEASADGNLASQDQAGERQAAWSEGPSGQGQKGEAAETPWLAEETSPKPSGGLGPVAGDAPAPHAAAPVIRASGGPTQGAVPAAPPADSGEAPAGGQAPAQTVPGGIGEAPLRPASQPDALRDVDSAPGGAALALHLTATGEAGAPPVPGGIPAWPNFVRDGMSAPVPPNHPPTSDQPAREHDGTDLAPGLKNAAAALVVTALTIFWAFGTAWRFKAFIGHLKSGPAGCRPGPRERARSLAEAFLWMPLALCRAMRPCAAAGDVQAATALPGEPAGQKLASRQDDAGPETRAGNGTSCASPATDAPETAAITDAFRNPEPSGNGHDADRGGEPLLPLPLAGSRDGDAEEDGPEPLRPPAVADSRAGYIEGHGPEPLRPLPVGGPLDGEAKEHSPEPILLMPLAGSRDGDAGEHGTEPLLFMPVAGSLDGDAEEHGTEPLLLMSGAESLDGDTEEHAPEPHLLMSGAESLDGDTEGHAPEPHLLMPGAGSQDGDAGEHAPEPHL